jgi:FlaA1/EpsC-like NDP-sugar epimerase
VDILASINPYRKFVILAIDLAISCAVFYLGFLILGQGHVNPELYDELLWGLALMAPIRLLVFNTSGLYRGIMKYASIDDLKNIFRAVALGSIVFVVVLFSLRGLGVEAYANFPNFVLVIDWTLNIIFIGGSRFLVRTMRSYRPAANTDQIRVLIVGAGDAGESILREIHFNPRSLYEVVGLMDDDSSKLHKQIHGVLVLGNTRELGSVFQDYDVDQVFIAIPNAAADLVRSIVEQCREHHVTFRKLPSVRDMIDGQVSISQMKEVQLEDLLGREPVELDLPSIGRFVSEHVVVVTGAAGSIGSELCRQVLKFSPSILICLDHNENGLYQLMQEFSDNSGINIIFPLVASITDENRINWIFDKYKPDVVFHAAAHKHVPMMERNRSEAIRNNVLGTRILVESAHAHNVTKFVMISTDKAVNPTSTMGVCKRVAEKIVRMRAVDSTTQFMTVRFGNVLGSSGSVVPLFKKQIEKGGPITITHPDIERYFMTISEAVQLVIQAAALGKGGEIFVLEMGTPMKIIDMARNLITLSGLQENVDVEVQIVGLRQGEKMTEELWVSNEKLIPTEYKKINMAVAEKKTADENLVSKINSLLMSINTKDDEELINALKKIVPTYTPVKGDNKRY